MFGQQSYTPQFELPDYAAQRLQLFQVNHVLQQDAMARAAELQRQQANIAGASYLENPTDANLALVAQQDPETATRLGQFVSSRASAQAQSQYTDTLRASQEQKNTLQQAQQALGLVNTAQGMNDPNARNAALQAAYGMVPSSLQDGLERVLAGGGQTDRSLQNLSQVLGGFIGPGELTPQQIEQLGGAGGVTQALTPQAQKALGNFAAQNKQARAANISETYASIRNKNADTDFARARIEQLKNAAAAEGGSPVPEATAKPGTVFNANTWANFRSGSSNVEPKGFATFEELNKAAKAVESNAKIGASAYVLSVLPESVLESGGASSLYADIAFEVKNAKEAGALDKGVEVAIAREFGSNPDNWDADKLAKFVFENPNVRQKLTSAARRTIANANNPNESIRSSKNFLPYLGRTYIERFMQANNGRKPTEQDIKTFYRKIFQ
jgi:hypothetical protein